jgi:hypothetical protein
LDRIEPLLVIQALVAFAVLAALCVQRFWPGQYTGIWAFIGGRYGHRPPTALKYVCGMLAGTSIGVVLMLVMVQAQAMAVIVTAGVLIWFAGIDSIEAYNERRRHEFGSQDDTSSCSPRGVV